MRFYDRTVGPIAGAVLAAGAGRRMGLPKAELELDGQRLLDRALVRLHAAGSRPVLAVVRIGVEVPAPAVAIVNPDPDRGMRSSLELAVTAAGSVAEPVAALAVILVDVPGLAVAAVKAVLAEWRPGRIAIGRFAGRFGHPIVMGLDQWRDAIALAGPDEGARGLLRTRPELIDPIDVAGDPTDLDTPADVTAWTAGRPASGA